MEAQSLIVLLADREPLVYRRYEHLVEHDAVGRRRRLGAGRVMSGAATRGRD